MGRLQTPQSVRLRRARGHDHEVRQSHLAMEARRKLERGDRGRMWLEGAELGGIDRRYVHLDRTYD
jgi:hypothetical protein